MMSTITHFIDSLSNDRFIEAHEILEQSWKVLKKEERYDEARIQKGLINAATAIGLHLERGKTDAARRVWLTFEKYRPLIKTLSTEATPLYREAATILDAKRHIHCPVSLP